MTLVEAVRRANQPGPPEDSVRLRVACTLAVLAAVLAATAEGEMSHPVALGAGAAVVTGMVFSYRTRARPPAWIKVTAAVAAVSVLVWFFEQLTATVVTDITGVEDPLTVMFVAIQVIHSFHVPSRRDLLFSIGAAAGLIAVAAAQAVDLSFAAYAGAWLAFSLWGLLEMWSSASGGAGISRVALGSALAGVLTAAAVAFFLLPAPVVSVRFSFQSRPGGAGPVPVPGALAGDTGSAAQLSKPGSPSGPTRVGGYLGFADRLDTALRGNLGRALVMYVRAERPSYWVGETFDTWQGQSWVAARTRPTHIVQQGSPFTVPLPEGDSAVGQPDLQTFYLAASGPDLVFHADAATQIWFPAKSVFYGSDGTIVSPIGLGKGAIYTVESDVVSPSPGQLRAAGGAQLPATIEREYTQLPHPYPRATALARSVTDGVNNTYDKVEALIGWIGAHTHYSTDIPPLPRGADTVNEFLFGNRVGFCEQISTSLAVMLRSLGIPAREVVGYVPGGYDPLTDLYEVRAEDAHAWVQVWFPGFGWQSFDPTAVVPDANPSPGGTALRDVGHALGRVPAAPAGTVVGGLGVVVGVLRWRRSRPATWAQAVTRHMERAGRRAGRPRRPAETLAEYAALLGSAEWESLAASVNAGVYGGRPTPPERQRDMVAAAKRLSSRGRRRPAGR